MNRHARGSVLVVDDEPTIGDVVCRYLDRAGYETRVARDGHSALEQVEQQAPDLIVLDLMLPGVEGLEVMRRIRDRDRNRTAIILLTARGEETDRIVGLRLGADDYVVKPFSPAELVARVAAGLRRAEPGAVGGGPPPPRACRGRRRRAAARRHGRDRPARSHGHRRRPASRADGEGVRPA